MTPDQVKMLKDSYMTEAKKPNGKKSTLGEYMRFHLDSSIDFVTSKDCIIFDDENTMLHCICINDDLKSQADFPLKVMTADYSVIHQIETIMSQENFKKFLNEGFISSLLSSEKKDFILKWAQNIRNQALQPMDADPFYSQNPQIIPMPNSVIKRDDGIEKATAPARMNWTIPHAAEVNGQVYKNFSEAIAAAIESGSVLVLGEDITLPEKLVIEENKSLSIDLHGQNLTIPEVDNNYGLVIKGSLTISDSIGNGDVYANGGYGIGLSTTCTGGLTINGGTFHGAENTDYVIGAFAGKVVVNDGDFSSPYCCINSFDKYKATVEINGGSFTTPAEPENETSAPLLGINITVNGGNFSKAIPEEYIAEGLMQKENTDGRYVIVEKPTLAIVNGVEYKSVNDAVAAAIENGSGEVVLVEDSNVEGLMVESGSTISIDLNGHTMTMQDPTTGSAGTMTNGFQFLKDSEVVLKNGLIKMDTAGMKILVQNYSDLTLENMVLDGTMEGTEGCKFVLSHNNGTVILKGDTKIIAADGQVAFDAYYWPKANYGDVIIKTEDFTGTIIGKIYTAHDDSVTDEVAAEHAKIIINGGVFSHDVSAYCAEGYITSKNEDGTYSVIEKPAVATVNGVEYKNFSDAINAVEAGGTMEMNTDVVSESTERVAYSLNNDITIEGNGTTITAPGNQKVFEINGDATNVTINSTTIASDFNAGRAVDTRKGNVTLNLEGTILETSGSGNTQTLTIGGNGDNNNVNAIDSAIKASDSGYAAIIYNPVNMNVNRSTIEGYVAFYMKGVDNSLGSAGSVINIDSSSVTGLNNHNGESNNCAAFLFEDNDITINISASGLHSIANGDTYEHIFNFNGHTGITVDIDSACFIDTTGDKAALATNFGENTKIILHSAEHAAMFETEGHTVTNNGDGTYTVTAAV